MQSTASMLESIRYRNGKLDLLEQRKLPLVSEYEEVKNAEDGWEAIRSMKVRGAPAIAIAGALSLAVEAHRILAADPLAFGDAAAAADFLVNKLEYLKTSRPTAVNLFEAADRLTRLARSKAATAAAGQEGARQVFQAYIAEAEKMLEDDIAANKAMGKHGADHILALQATDGGNVRVITHCNTGSLATAGYGTALGVIRALNESGRLERAFCTETRPYNQGARLTAYELVAEQIPGTLVTDSMVAALMNSSNKPHAVIVGADRIAANGDTANKIGTYQLAIAAKYHKVPFFVAAPLTTIDLDMVNGSGIKIEERPADELTNVNGMRIAAPGIGVWNPSFDVTPGELIDGIITELGVIQKGADGHFHVAQFIKDKSASH